jgi:hypothetical protein
LEEREAKVREDIIMQRANQLQAACPDMLVGEGVLIAQLLDYTDEQWSAKVAEVVEEKAKAAEELRIAQEKAAREALVQERVEKLKAAGWSHLKSYDGKDLVQLGNDDAPIIVETFTPDVFDACISAGQAAIARRAAAHQEQLRQEAEAAARVRLEAEQADPKTVTVERERLLRLLFSIQEVLPYAMNDDAGGNWNTSIEALAEDVMELRRDLGDETLGPTF